MAAMLWAGSVAGGRLSRRFLFLGVSHGSNIERFKENNKNGKWHQKLAIEFRKEAQDATKEVRALREEIHLLEKTMQIDPNRPERIDYDIKKKGNVISIDFEER